MYPCKIQVHSAKYIYFIPQFQSLIVIYYTIAKQGNTPVSSLSCLMLEGPEMRPISCTTVSKLLGKSDRFGGGLFSRLLLGSLGGQGGGDIDQPLFALTHQCWNAEYTVLHSVPVNENGEVEEEGGAYKCKCKEWRGKGCCNEGRYEAGHCLGVRSCIQGVRGSGRLTEHECDGGSWKKCKNQSSDSRHDINE